MDDVFEGLLDCEVVSEGVCVGVCEGVCEGSFERGDEGIRAGLLE